MSPRVSVETSTLHVVSGALVSRLQGGLLMCLRRSTALRPRLWELAGGKVDPSDASPRDALAREWAEELYFLGSGGVELPVVVAAGERIATGIVEADVRVLIELFEVSLVKPQESGRPHEVSSGLVRSRESHGLPLSLIRSRDHDEVRWVDPRDAVRNLPCSPGFYVHYPFLRLWWEGLCV